MKYYVDRYAMHPVDEHKYTRQKRGNGKIYTPQREINASEKRALNLVIKISGSVVWVHLV